RVIGCDLPGLDRLVQAAGNHRRVVQVEGQVRDSGRVGVTLHRFAELCGWRLTGIEHDIEGKHRFIVTRDGKDLTVWAEPEARYRTGHLDLAQRFSIGKGVNPNGLVGAADRGQDSIFGNGYGNRRALGAIETPISDAVADVPEFHRLVVGRGQYVRSA